MRIGKKGKLIALLVLICVCCLCFSVGCFGGVNQENCSHSNKTFVSKREATCEIDGYSLYHCDACGADVKEDLVEATGHKYDDGVIITQGTCTKDGEKTYTCRKCDETKTETIKATGHKYDGSAITKKPTCTDTGVKTYFCSECDERKTEIVDATGHKFNDGVVTTQPTCTNAGEKTYSCSDCNTKKTEAIAAKGHKFNDGVVTTQPTCANVGEKTYSCSDCNTKRTEPIAAKGHKFNEGVVTKQAACAETGEKTFTCSDCGELKTEIIAALGHTESAEGVVTKQPTCTVNGVKTFYCSVCSEALRTTDILAGHSYNNGVVTKHATCTEEGIKTYTCSSCGGTKTQTFSALGHTEVAIGQGRPATCQEEGWTSGIKCSTCGVVLEEQHALPLTNHNFVQGICSVCNEEKVYKVTFVIDGVTVDVQTFTVSNKNIVEPTIPEKAGYAVVGWEKYTLLDDVTVNAIYKPISYRITLNAGNGTCATKTYDVNYHMPYTLPVPVYEGYIFVGWFSSASSNAEQYTDDKGVSLSVYDYSGDKRYYAQYSAPQVQIVFDFDNGQPNKTTTVTYGTAFSATETPTKEGSIFDGWYTADGEEYTFSTIIKQSVTLKAKWTVSKPISTAEELFAIKDDPTANYHLTKDIILPNSNKVWTAIVNFSGILNGNGYSIKNISFTTGDNAEYYGFIRYNEGTIENLNFERIVFTQRYTHEIKCCSGVIAGENSGTIKNCHILSGTHSYNISFTTRNGNNNSRYVFGIVGINRGTILDCSSKIDYSFVAGVTASEGCTGYTNNLDLMIGGIVGDNYGLISKSWYEGSIYATTGAVGKYSSQINFTYLGAITGVNEGTINECYAVADITFTSAKDGRVNKAQNHLRLGGIVGTNCAQATIKNSFSNGVISAGATDGQFVGGFAGENHTLSNIYNCYTTADVNVAIAWGSYGGFIGYNDGANIAGCYASGNLVSEVSGNSGGFVGACSNAGGSISNCYSCSNVTTAGGTAGLFVGSSPVAISDCYFMKDAYLSIGGVRYDVSSELNGTINGKGCYEVWSEAFLTEELFWTSEDGWIILTDEDPILDWETAVFHDYKTYVFEPTCDYAGYTLYLCTDCTRFFVREIVEPLGHEYDYDHPNIKPATCTQNGWKYYTCLREGCQEEDGRVFIEEYYAPLGHTKGEVVHGEHTDGLDKTYSATCEKAGRTTYACAVCGGEFSEVEPALGHDEYTTKNEVEATCYFDAGLNQYIMNGGYTAEILCKRCSKVIQERKDVEPHHHMKYEYTLKPTCTEMGGGVGTCEMCKYKVLDAQIPALGHNDINGDHRCDRCKTLMITSSEELKEGEYVAINDENGLKAIANDLNGTYVITADINLTGAWVSLGSEEKPFTGRLFGEGYKISGLTCVDSKVGGLFAYNKGFISGVTINGYNLTLNNSDCVFGSVTAYNGGVILDCEVIGEAVVDIKTSLITNEAMSNTKTSTHMIGGIVGINENIGKVSFCQSTEAIFTNKFENIATTLFKADYNWFVTAIGSLVGSNKVKYKKYITNSTDTIYSGQICGYNSTTGVIDNCTATGVGQNSVKVLAETKEYVGTSVASTYLHQNDSICGYNIGTYEGNNTFGVEFTTTVVIKEERLVEGFYYKQKVDFAIYQSKQNQ